LSLSVSVLGLLISLSHLLILSLNIFVAPNMTIRMGISRPHEGVVNDIPVVQVLVCHWIAGEYLVELEVGLQHLRVEATEQPAVYVDVDIPREIAHVNFQPPRWISRKLDDFGLL